MVELPDPSEPHLTASTTPCNKPTLTHPHPIAALPEPPNRRPRGHVLRQSLPPAVLPPALHPGLQIPAPPHPHLVVDLVRLLVEPTVLRRPHPDDPAGLRGPA